MGITRHLTIAAVAAASATFAATAQADVKFTETFTYADGELAAASSNVWTAHSGTGGQTVTGNTLAISDAGTGDYNRAVSSVITSGTVYAAFDLTVSSADLPSSAAGQYFAHFAGATLSGAGTTFVSRVTLASSTTSGKFEIGIARGSGTGATTSFWGTALDPDVTYRVVHAYDLTTSASTLWINPTTIGSTSITNSTGDLVAASIDFYALRISGSSDGDKLLDNLVVATTFAEVVPEPAGLALLGLGSLALIRRRAA